MEEKAHLMDPADPSAFDALATAYATFEATRWTDARYKRTLSKSKREEASAAQLQARGALSEAIRTLAAPQDLKQEEKPSGPSNPLLEQSMASAMHVLREALQTEQTIKAQTAGAILEPLIEQGTTIQVQISKTGEELLGVPLGDEFIVLCTAHQDGGFLSARAGLILDQEIQKRGDRAALTMLKAAQKGIEKASTTRTQDLEAAQQATWKAAGTVAHLHRRQQHVGALIAAMSHAYQKDHIDHAQLQILGVALLELQTKYLSNSIDFKAFDAGLASLCRQLMYGGAKEFFSMRLHIHLGGHALEANLLKTLNDKVRQLVDKVPGIDTESARSRLEGIKQLQGEDLEALVQAQRGVLDQVTYGLMKLMMLALTAVLVVGVGVAALAASTGIGTAILTTGVAASLYALPKLWKGFFNKIAAGSHALSEAMQDKKSNRSYVALLGMSIVQSAILAVGWSAQLVGQLGVFVDKGVEKISQLVQNQLTQQGHSQAATRIRHFGEKLDRILLADTPTFTEQTQALLGSLGQTVTGPIGGVLAACCAAFAGFGQLVSEGIQHGIHEEAGARLQGACQSALQSIKEQFECMTQALREQPAQLVSDLQNSIKKTREPDVIELQNASRVEQRDIKEIVDEFKEDPRKSSYI